MEPLISVIIPVYNVLPYLREALDSVISQTYKNLEIIIIDDGSTDGSEKLCDELAARDPRIQVIHKKNEGASVARNCGLDVATGDYIGFVDSDDYIDEHMYETLLSLCNDYEAQIATVRYDDVINGSIVNTCGDENIYCLDRNEYLRNIAFGKFTKLRITPSVWTNLYKKELIQHIRFVEDRVIAEDMLFNCEALINTMMCVYIDKCLYHYRNREDSVTGIRFTDFVDCRLKQIPLYQGEIDFLSSNNCPAADYFRCSYYNSIIPLVAEQISQEERETVDKFITSNHLSFTRIMKMKMPVKSRIESLKKHSLRHLYTFLKRMQAIL